MSRRDLGLLVSVALTVAVLTGCDRAAGETTEVVAEATSVKPVTTAAEAGPLLPERDPAKIKKACGNMLTAITARAKLVAEAEKIGPPAGYIAVGAHYIGGSVEVSAKSLPSQDTTVIDAAGRVADEMSALDAAWQKNPAKKPSKAALHKAVAELKAVCAAG